MPLSTPAMIPCSSAAKFDLVTVQCYPLHSFAAVVKNMTRYLACVVRALRQSSLNDFTSACVWCHSVFWFACCVRKDE
eukprot:3389225-Amphidinium_carterae.1